jgi:hypothetical protein
MVEYGPESSFLYKAGVEREREKDDTVEPA